MGAPRVFPIRRKLILIFLLLVGVSTAVYLGLAIRLFLRDRTQLVAEVGSYSVKSLALEARLQIDHYRQTFDAIAPGAVISDGQWSALTNLWSRDAGVVAAAAPGRSWSRLSDARKSLLLKDARPAGLATDLAWNASDAQWGPVLAFPVREGVTLWISLDPWIKRVADEGSVERYLVDSQGRILAGPSGEAFTVARQTLAGHPLLEEALISPVSAQGKTFEWQGKRWVGGFASVGKGGIFALVQIAEQEAFKAAWRLIERSILVALFVLTLAVVLARWFARGLTVPLAHLVEATGRLARGDWDSTVHVLSRDEVGELARAFNSMVTDLRSSRDQLGLKKKEIEQTVAERTQTLLQEKKSVSETQEALVRTTKLASLGELAGVTAHEVLNPINNMSIRLQRMRSGPHAQDKADLSLLGSVEQAWSKAFQEGGLRGLVREMGRPSQNPQVLMIAEDLQNFESVLKDFQERVRAREQDFAFLDGEIGRVTRIVNQMRSLSRVGGERKVFDIHQALDATLTSLKESFENQHIAVVKEYSAEPRTLFQIQAIQDELIQVFANLFRNAQYAVSDAQRRQGQVRVVTRRVGNRVEVRISDNGVGISAENQRKLFETQFTTKGFEKGTGLGLSISRRITRAFNGDLELESSIEGQGTTFLIWFPQAASLDSKE